MQMKPKRWSNFIIKYTIEQENVKMCHAPHVSPCDITCKAFASHDTNCSLDLDP